MLVNPTLEEAKAELERLRVIIRKLRGSGFIGNPPPRSLVSEINFVQGQIIALRGTEADIRKIAQLRGFLTSVPPLKPSSLRTVRDLLRGIDSILGTTTEEITIPIEEPTLQFPIFINGFRTGELVFSGKIRNQIELDKLLDGQIDDYVIINEGEVTRPPTDETIGPAEPVNPFFRDKNGNKIFLNNLSSTEHKQIKLVEHIGVSDKVV